MAADRPPRRMSDPPLDRTAKDFSACGLKLGAPADTGGSWSLTTCCVTSATRPFGRDTDFVPLSGSSQSPCNKAWRIVEIGPD
ncbi:hypothetical protein J155_01444 [Xanthomonas citri pv. citri]|nr:hypothetical protein J151_01446 [Xanthomonas citri subsp. citri A306]AJY81425.1 hypothetical protein J159_01442 [Xanthomonas citri pv. citri]AJY85847.1 hypothetical protein J158_01442 [Xanthomonas citri subsp. citri UI6]AJY90271.1 hypothetical protein J169_01442 [Xanthomonas citri pv. citri]AJY94742.1 hypothetical protein J164_01442 [Xanthomonas citri pv. citri]